MSFNFVQVVGLVGPKAAGKTTAANYLVARHGFHHYLLSNPLRAEAKKRGINPITVSTLQDIGDTWRHQLGPGVLTLKTLNLAKKRKHRKIVIDGIRNPGEIQELITHLPPNRLLLIGIKAPVWTRYHRIKMRGQTDDQLNYRQFLLAHRRDMGQNQPPDGQQVAQCLKLIPKENLIINHNGIKTLTRSLETLYQRYLSHT